MLDAKLAQVFAYGARIASTKFARQVDRMHAHCLSHRKETDGFLKVFLKEFLRLVQPGSPSGEPGRRVVRLPAHQAMGGKTASPTTRRSPGTREVEDRRS